MENDPAFAVFASPLVRKRLPQLMQQAKDLGIEDRLADVWQAIFATLQTAPESFGEPRRRTKLPGGMVYQGLFKHCVVDFVVYRKQAMVYVFGVRLLTRFFDTPS